IYFLKLLTELNDIYTEVNEYNDNYYSKFLYFMWNTYTILISCYTYFAFYGNNDSYLMRVIFITIVIMIMEFLILLIYISSALYNQTNRTYILLNILYQTYKHTY